MTILTHDIHFSNTLFTFSPLYCSHFLFHFWCDISGLFLGQRVCGVVIFVLVLVCCTDHRHLRPCTVEDGWSLEMTTCHPADRELCYFHVQLMQVQLFWTQPFFLVWLGLGYKQSELCNPGHLVYAAYLFCGGLLRGLSDPEARRGSGVLVVDLWLQQRGRGACR